MTMWQFAAAVAGWKKAHGQGPKGGGGNISDERLREMGIEGF
jgi:hypothetical protein